MADTKPSEAAKRITRAVMISLSNQGRLNVLESRVADKAAIAAQAEIDREYKPLVEAAREMLDAHPKYPRGIGCEGSLARQIQDRQNAAVDALRSAIQSHKPQGGGGE